MRFESKEFNAEYSPMWNDWKIETDKFIVRVKYLLIESMNGIKNKYQKLIGKDVEFELMKDEDQGMIVILSWKKLDKKKLWDLSDPDQPKNLAKTVTVR